MTRLSLTIHSALLVNKHGMCGACLCVGDAPHLVWSNVTRQNSGKHLSPTVEHLGYQTSGSAHPSKMLSRMFVSLTIHPYPILSCCLCFVEVLWVSKLLEKVLGSDKLLAYVEMVRRWMFFCKVVSIIEYAGSPVETKVFPEHSVAQPVKSHVHCLCLFWLDSVVDNSFYCWVVCLDWSGRMFVSQFF